MAAVRVHKVPSDKKHCMRGEKLRKAMKSDTEKGLIPFCVSKIKHTFQNCFILFNGKILFYQFFKRDDIIGTPRTS